MDPVVHFEMPAVDRDRMARFYEAVFGWETQQMGPEMGSYTVVTTTPPGEQGRPPGWLGINGGFYMRTEDPASHAPGIVIAVEEIEASIAAVKRAGGTVAGPAQEIPGVGLYASFTDTEGNRVSLLQPAPRDAPAS